MPRKVEPAGVVVPAPTLAASRLAQLDVCPGFISDIFEQDTDAADSGSRIHDAVDKGVIPDDMTAEERELTEWCLNLLDELAGTYYSVQKEASIQIPYINKPGWVDALLISHDGRRAIVMDWKTGRNKQAHPSENLQFKAYAVAVWMKYPGLEEVTLVGAYPRLRSVEKASFGLPEFQQMLAKLAELHVRCQDFQGRLRPNENCKYCGRASTCAPLASAAVTTLKVLKADLPAGLDPEKVPLDRPDVLAAMMDMGDVLSGWIKAVKARANYSVVKMGIDLPGYRLETKSGTRAFRNPDEILALVNAALLDLGSDPVTMDKITKPSVPSPSEVEGALKALAPKGQGAAWVRQFKQVCDDATAIQANDEITYLKRDPAVRIVLTDRKE